MTRKTDKQKRLSELVNREVLACQTGPVTEMLEKGVRNYSDIETPPFEPAGSGCESCNCQVIVNTDGLCIDCHNDQSNEVLEWWLVTEWLADKLKAEGETILEFDILNRWWGRKCSGQAISLDDVIERIYDSCQN